MKNAFRFLKDLDGYKKVSVSKTDLVDISKKRKQSVSEK